jgi:LacI family transcriptional regulator
MPRERRTTLQDIADRTGYARSTVSLALRDHPSIPVATRAKIHAAARDLGYRPNPLVSALMTQLRGARRANEETIGLINLAEAPFPDLVRRNLFYRQLHDGIRSEADALGVRFDEFVIGPELASSIDRILRSRGIHGLLIFPGSNLNDLGFELEWERYASVHIGFGQDDPIHQVVSDYFHDIDLALRVLRERNIRRVGFAVSTQRDRSIDFSWTSRFLLFQQETPARSRIPLINSKEAEFDRDHFLDWFTRHRPDAILVAGEREYQWLLDAGVSIPGECGVINLVQRGETEMTGVNPRTDQVGCAAVSLLMSLLESNQFGLPRFPRTISIRGEWIEGKTLSC